MKHSCSNLKNFICPAPFKDLMIFEHSTSVCCPEWFDMEYLEEKYPEKFDNIPVKVPSLVSQIEDVNDLNKNWNNKFHKDLRDSIKDGSYSFCTKMCPFISRAYTLSKEEFENDPHFGDWTYERAKEKLNLENPVPELVYFNFDKSCNLKCPSCRVELIHNGMSVKAQSTMDAVENQFASNIKMITCTGSGDPFYSNVFREWLFNFDPKRYPKLEHIFLVSNGNMFTEKIWSQMDAVKPYITGMEWSIDAGTRDTYETRTRLNGKWDKLMDNMDFLASIQEHFTSGLTFSFVVQKDNYKELVEFANLINSKFNNGKSFVKILFRALQDWRHQPKHWYNMHSVCTPGHPLYKEAVEEITKVHSLPNVDSNLFQLIKKAII